MTEMTDGGPVASSEMDATFACPAATGSWSKPPGIEPLFCMMPWDRGRRGRKERKRRGQGDTRPVCATRAFLRATCACSPPSLRNAITIPSCPALGCVCPPSPPSDIVVSSPTPPGLHLTGQKKDERNNWWRFLSPSKAVTQAHFSCHQLGCSIHSFLHSHPFSTFPLSSQLASLHSHRAVTSLVPTTVANHTLYPFHQTHPIPATASVHLLTRATKTLTAQPEKSSHCLYTSIGSNASHDTPRKHVPMCG